MSKIVMTGKLRKQEIWTCKSKPNFGHNLASSKPNFHTQKKVSTLMFPFPEKNPLIISFQSPHKWVLK